MKRFFVLTFVLLLVAAVNLQAQEMPGLDKSPADIAYFPGVGERDIQVVYSRPQKNGREIFGALIPYDKMWRTGANEATMVMLAKDATIGGESIEAGTYALFTIPGEDEWTVVFNSQASQWGNYNYDESKDVARFTVPSQETSSTVEAFTIAFKEVDGGAHMILAWDDTMVEIPVMF